LPNIYKASSITLAEEAVPIDIGDGFEMRETIAKTHVKQNSTIKNENRSLNEHWKSKEDFLDEARDEAEIIILKARNEAQMIIDNAEREVERERAETLENARSQGYGDGYNKGAAEAEALKREAEEAMRDTRAEYEEMLNNLEPQAVELIIKILNKLLGGSVRFNPQVILNLIREGLYGVVGSDGVKLRVSTDDYDYVYGHLDEITEYAGANSVELIKDAALKPMDCVIETSYGNIDSSLDQQFESLKADLLYTLSSEEA